MLQLQCIGNGTLQYTCTISDIDVYMSLTICIFSTVLHIKYQVRYNNAPPPPFHPISIMLLTFTDIATKNWQGRSSLTGLWGVHWNHEFDCKAWITFGVRSSYDHRTMPNRTMTVRYRTAIVRSSYDFWSILGIVRSSQPLRFCQT